MKILTTLAIFILATAATTFSSCSGSAGGTLASSDSVSIHFFEPGSQTTLKSMTATDQNAVKKMAGFLNGKSTEQFKCGYDGKLVFYSKGKASDIPFVYKDDQCLHFLQDDNGTLKATVLGNEAKDFFTSAASGKNWY